MARQADLCTRVALRRWEAQEPRTLSPSSHQQTCLSSTGQAAGHTRTPSLIFTSGGQGVQTSIPFINSSQNLWAVAKIKYVSFRTDREMPAACSPDVGGK